jgi:hypothetical protein
MPDLEQDWNDWLEQPGQRFTRVDAENSAQELVDRLRHSCTPEMLAEVCCGDLYTVLAGRIVRDHEQKAVAAEFRRQGFATRIESADDLGRGVACVRVVALRKRPSLYDLFQAHSIQRCAIAFMLENCCRDGLVQGDPQASLREGRRIFRHCLMYGRDVAPLPGYGPLHVRNAIVQLGAGASPSDTPVPLATPGGDRFDSLAAKHHTGTDLAPAHATSERDTVDLYTVSLLKIATL